MSGIAKDLPDKGSIFNSGRDSARIAETPIRDPKIKVDKPFEDAGDKARDPTPIKTVIQIHPTHGDVLADRRAVVEHSSPSRVDRNSRVFDPPDISDSAGPIEIESARWTNYRNWNRALMSFFLPYSATNTTVCLTVTPRILAAAWRKSEGEDLEFDRATALFVRTVSEIYHHDVLPQREGLRVLKCTQPDSLPLCTAFLAVAVLAAYSMRTDSGYSANACSARLAQLLIGPKGDIKVLRFEADEYYALWAYLQSWIRNQKGASLFLPARNEANKILCRSSFVTCSVAPG